MAWCSIKKMTGTTLLCDLFHMLLSLLQSCMYVCMYVCMYLIDVEIKS
jgi:hypothetical protein